MASDPIYSQAFNFGGLVQKGVDPRTGQYTCVIDLYETPAKVRNCASFKLSLIFSPLNPEDIGLGSGWSFNTSYLDIGPVKTLMLSTGEQYKIAHTASNLFVTDKKLKSFDAEKLQEGLFKIAYKSGQVEILDNKEGAWNRAVPVKVYAPNGRALTMNWERYGTTPRLASIQDGDHILLEVGYEDALVNVTRYPNTSEEATFKLEKRNKELRKLYLPLENAPPWGFTYHPSGQTLCITNVASPSGLLEVITYEADGHKLPPAPNSGPRSIPRAISHTSHPGNGQGPIKSLYTYSDTNFLGYGGGYNWRADEDNLYLVRSDYQYWTRVKVEGGPFNTYTYNKYHLLVRSEEQRGHEKKTTSITFHASVGKSFEEQCPQYQLPHCVENKYEDTATNKSRSESTEQCYDEWGNPIYEKRSDGLKISRTYYSEDGESDTKMDLRCPADPLGFRRYLKQEVVTPAESEFSAPTRTESYVYAQLDATSGTKTDHFVVVEEKRSSETKQGLEALTLLTRTKYSYVDEPSSRDHSRLRKRETFLFDQERATDQVTNYLYPKDNELKATVTTTSFDNIAVAEETIYSMLSGKTLRHTDYAGIEDGFEYDVLGRLVKAVTCPQTNFKAARQFDYDFLADVIGCSTTITDVKGVQTRYITDGLERLCQIEKQDGNTDAAREGKSSSATFREIENRSYNTESQCIKIEEIDWLRQTDAEDKGQRSSRLMEYDGWGQLCKVTENGDLVSLSLSDPIALTQTEGIEGEGTVITQLNNSGAPVKKELYHSDGKLYSSVTYRYDGLGRLVEQGDHLGRKSAYEADEFDRICRTTWPEDRILDIDYAKESSAPLPVSIKLGSHSLGHQSFDGSGRLQSRKIGSRSTDNSYQGNAPEPHQITTAMGLTQTMTYEPALDYALTDRDGGDHADHFEYDCKTAALLLGQNSYCTQIRKYLPSGLLMEEDLEVKGGAKWSAQYSYSMAGKLQEYTHWHDKVQTIRYDDFGRPSSLTQGTLGVSFTYDKASRLAKSDVEDKEYGAKLASLLTYDDFGREVTRTVYNGDAVLYVLSQTYGETGLISTRHLEDGQGSVLQDEAFKYDIHNRLIDYEVSGTQPPMDAYRNEIQKQSFDFNIYDNVAKLTTVFMDGSTNIAAYSFDEDEPTRLSKVTNSHKNYISIINLQYDRNGCLICDDQGRDLVYDALGRLAAVRSPEQELLCEYHYDAAGRLVCQTVPGGSDTYLFYREDSLVAIQEGECRISFLSDGKDYWGQISENNGVSETQLWACNNRQSVLAWFTAQDTGQVDFQRYTPYGDGMTRSTIGFNGQWHDPVTGWYHLGNGYRVYNPVLMRFHEPDPWSPFISGEINPYTYCLGDPINRLDPTGHFSIFGLEFGWKDLFLAVAGTAASIAAGVLTGGASLAIQVGVGIAVGVVTEMVSSTIYDIADGKPPTWSSIGMDALTGLVGGVAGEIGGQAIKQGFRAFKAAPVALKRALGRAGSIAITPAISPAQQSLKQSIRNVAASGIRGAARGFIPAKVASGGTVALLGLLSAEPSRATSTQGESDPQLLQPGYVDLPYLDQGSAAARDIIRPALKDGQTDSSGQIGPSTYGASGQSLTSLLNRDVRYLFTTPGHARADSSSGTGNTYRLARSALRSPHVPNDWRGTSGLEGELF